MPSTPSSQSPTHLPTHVSTFAHQNHLPRLPIPNLEKTFELYLESLKPLVTPEELAQSQSRVRAFLEPGGMGPVLQERLMQWDRKQKHSWLESIWLDKAYLEWRDPSLVNSNWWAAFKNHPKHPKMLLSKPPPRGAGLSSFQVTRAAGLVRGFVDYMLLIAKSKIQPDTVSGTPQCMSQLTRIFSTSRIPDLPRDHLSTTFPPTARHIIVMIRGQLYQVQVLSDEGTTVPLAEIERLLYAAARDAMSGTPQPHVGVMTGAKRDDWAATRRHLDSLSPTNTLALSTISDALFVLCLDDYTLPGSDFHLQLFHGHGQNRWFDKTVQLVVANDGRAGVNAEHAAVDAMVVVKVFEHALGLEPVTDLPTTLPANLPDPVKLQWVTDTTVLAALDAASASVKETAKGVEVRSATFPVYGREYMARVATTSPDAYLQLAFQLTWHRLYDRPTATYEPASTRGFRHGRTETVRVCSEESEAWARGFDDDGVAYADKLALFRAAAAKHVSLVQAATQGQGIDRHLLGLRCMIRSDEERRQCDVFADESFARSMWFRLSTSNIGGGVDTWGGHGGFGAVTRDGYGVSYSIGRESVVVTVAGAKRGGVGDGGGSGDGSGSVGGRGRRSVDVKRFLEMVDRTMKDMMVMFPKRSEVMGKGSVR
ncbi:hypothetical protein HDU93_008818 [Gonapodya sp. JEL0774]|nr:hypothetical protein HDU93_008818 [Gonapodya sp. JEL0774]